MGDKYSLDIMALSKQDPCMHIQSTPDNLISGNWKKFKLSEVRVIGSLKQITGNKKINKQIDGKGMQVSCALHINGSKRYRLIFYKRN